MKHDMVRFRMIRIATNQFAILSGTPKSNEVSIDTSVNLKYAADGGAVAVNVGFRFESGEQDLMLLDLTCEFQIHRDDLEEMKIDGKVTIKKSLLDYFVAQTVGTARGILHCKTEGTALNGIILPPIDVSHIIDKDVTFVPTVKD